jgi:fatty acid desaturase
LPILIKTWFAPWKNDRLAANNASLADQIKILELNFASRLVGVLVRSIVIALTILILALVMILAVIGLAIWILVPFAWLLLPLIAITMIYR